MEPIRRIRASAVIVHNDQLLTFLAKDPTSGEQYLFLPGGEIEKGETPHETAIRETLEETGFDIQLDPNGVTEREYPFYWNGKDYISFTLFYRARLKNPFQKVTVVKDADYHLGVVWMPLSELHERFSYSAEILSAIEELITSHQ